jgi:hypothetical protein
MTPPEPAGTGDRLRTAISGLFPRYATTHGIGLRPVISARYLRRCWEVGHDLRAQ